jgi:hypothetical protein
MLVCGLCIVHMKAKMHAERSKCRLGRGRAEGSPRLLNTRMRWAGCAARALHTYQLKLMVIRERSEMILYSILPRRYGTSHASHVGDRGVVFLLAIMAYVLAGGRTSQ